MKFVTAVYKVIYSSSAVTLRVGQPPKAATWTGTVRTSNIQKHTFTITVDTKTYTVDYSSKTKWVKGKAADLKKGVKVKVTGTLSKSTIEATSISV